MLKSLFEMNYGLLKYRYEIMAAVSLITVFLLDTLTPPKFVLDILYLCCILPVFKKRRRTIIGFGLAACLLIGFNTWWFDHRWQIDVAIIVNRSVSVLAICITVYIAVLYRTVQLAGHEKDRQYLRDLNQMLFMTSHKVRKPVANILGLVQLISVESEELSPEACAEHYAHLATSALELDDTIKELNAFVSKVEKSKS